MVLREWDPSEGEPAERPLSTRESPSVGGLRHIDLGALVADREQGIIVAAESTHSTWGELVSGLTSQDCLLTVLRPSSSDIQEQPDARIQELTSGLYRVLLPPMEAGRHVLHFRDRQSPPRFLPILGTLDVRMGASERTMNVPLDVQAAIVHDSARQLFKARLAVRQGGRLVDFQTARFALFDEHTEEPIELTASTLRPDANGFAHFDVPAELPSGLRIFACRVTIGLCGDCYEVARLFPVYRAFP